MARKYQHVQELLPQIKERCFSIVVKSIEVMSMARIWILLSALIVDLLRLSSVVK